MAKNIQNEKELYLEYQVLTEQLKKVERYLEQTTESLAELAGTITNLDEFRHIKKGTRLFAPIANGIFIDATLNDAKLVRMNVGKSVVVTRTIDEAKALLEQQREELKELQRRAEADHLKIHQRLKEIEKSVEEE